MPGSFFEDDSRISHVEEIAQRRRDEAGTRAGKRAHGPNPITPIPPRASALPSQQIKIRPRYSRIAPEYAEEEDITRIPTTPPANTWQYDSPLFTAESSLSTLSLMSPALAPVVPLSPAIDELDTVPPPLSRELFDEHSHEADIAELDTQPPPPARGARKTVRLYTAETLEEELGPAAFLANIPELSPARNTAQPLPPWPMPEIARTEQPKQNVVQPQKQAAQPRRVALFNPLDHARWWLLYPGRLEFVLWLAGTVVLLLTTGLLLFAAFLSIGLLQSGQHASSQEARSTAVAGCSEKQPCGSVSTTSPTGIKLTILSTTSLQVGKAFRLQGQGFTARGRVNLTYDAWIPCEPTFVTADEHGTFQILLSLGTAAPGSHNLVASDVGSTHTVTLPLKLVAASTPAQVTPRTTRPGTTTPGSTSPAPPAGEQTPIVPSPTQNPPQQTPTAVAQPSPTSSPATPTAVPTARPTPPAGTTPTPIVTVTPVAPSYTTGAAITSSSHISAYYITLYQGVSPLRGWLWFAGLLAAMALLFGCVAACLRHLRKDGKQQ